MSDLGITRVFKESSKDNLAKTLPIHLTSLLPFTYAIHAIIFFSCALGFSSLDWSMTSVFPAFALIPTAWGNYGGIADRDCYNSQTVLFDQLFPEQKPWKAIRPAGLHMVCSTQFCLPYPNHDLISRFSSIYSRHANDNSQDIPYTLPPCRSPAFIQPPHILPYTGWKVFLLRDEGCDVTQADC